MRLVIPLIVVLGAIAAALAVFAARIWESGVGPEMSIHGYIALALGALFTFALTAGLMALVFYSNRQGYDDGAGSPDDIDERLG